MSLIVLSAPSGPSQNNPVRRAVASAAKALGVDKGLHKPDRVPVHLFPVTRQRCRHAAENVRGQMRHLNPGQNQKARVISDETNVALAGFLAPADVAVAAPQMARRRTPGQAGDGTSLRPHQIFQMFADRLLVAEVMMMLEEAIEQRLITASAHLLHL